MSNDKIDQFTPNYFKDTSNDTVQMLMQKLNITATREIEFILQLTSLKNHLIPYKQAIVATDTEDEPYVFTNIIQKLEKLQIVMLRHKILRASLVPSFIRLCNESAPIFFKEFVTEQNFQCFITNDHRLPTNKTLANIGIHIPSEQILPYSEELCIQALLDEKKREADDFTSSNTDIFVIRITDNEQFMFTDESMPKIADIMIKRIQEVVDEGILLPIISSTLNLNETLQELKEKMSSKDIIIWQSFINQLYDGLETMKAKSNLTTYNDFFDYVIILYHMIPVHVKIIDQQRIINQQIVDFQQSMLKKISSYQNGINEMELNALLSSEVKNTEIPEAYHNKAIERFRNENIISANQTKNIDFEEVEYCIKIQNIYIHSHSILEILGNNFYKLSQSLEEYYQDLLNKYLTNQLSHKENVFVNQESLNTSVHQKVFELDPLYYQILKSPILLATLLSKRFHSKIPTAFDTMPSSKKLALFFDLRTKSILPWYEIFNIKLSLLVEKSYKTLSIFKKVILLFTGRYKNMLKKIDQIQKSNAITLPTKEELAKMEAELKLTKKKASSINSK